MKHGPLLLCLTDLFGNISIQSQQTGYVTPKSFVKQLGRDNEMFRGRAQQDGHEFYNYILNAMIDQLKAEAPLRSAVLKHESVRWKTVRSLFEGVLKNETKCMCCETITSRTESFLDLSLEIEPYTSILASLRKFLGTETLGQDEKFYCASCRCLQVQYCIVVDNSRHLNSCL